MVVIGLSRKRAIDSEHGLHIVFLERIFHGILQTLVHLGGHTQEIVALSRLQLRDEYRFMQ